ncbi:hypothetical protein [Oceanobacillus sp. J11TS1]|uniref:hypothetical protein n=1 Tax=Oceanobacillus sp. J11TS1 TaxID=2807191 RepID=UPI001B257DB3|nr:hypothetical protein [Oceanobacillus sp. J11TS1]GIO23656.1 hypothetical protein J11TS1_22370 [Oceanobacillus sp. J11TS1]
MLLSKLEEKDFQVLRGPLESGRQSPKLNGVMLLFAIPLEILTFFLAHAALMWNSSHPYKEQIFYIHLIVEIIIIFLSIIYAIPAVYKRNEKLQYLMIIIVSQNLFGITAYLFTLYIVGKSNASEGSLLMFTFITLLLGIFVFIGTCVRFNILLKKGQYRKGSKKDELRGYFEKNSFVSLGVFGGLGALYIIQYIGRNFDGLSLDSIFIAILCMGIFYTMIFVLPEQLVILYCKYRFDSLNFEQNGRIKPFRDENGNIIR